MKLQVMRAWLALLALAILGAGEAEAQSLYALEGAAGTVVEIAGPPSVPCIFPNGPIISSFSYALAFTCPLPAAVPSTAPVGLGDVGVDRVADTIWVTDGALIGNYTTAGAPISGFAMPAIGLGPLMGLGVDSAAGVLWVTDGVLAAAIAPPPAPGCPGPAPTVVVLPFPIPGPGPFTDIEWDGTTGSLFASMSGGSVSNFLSSGAPGSFGVYAVAAGCPVGALTGIAVDASGPPGAGITYVVGAPAPAANVARVLPGGAAAPPTFYTPNSCFALPATLSLNGLAFAARAITYGSGGGSTIEGIGESLTPNPGFAIKVAGGPVPSLGFLVYTNTWSCPLPVLGGVTYVGVFPFIFAPIVGGGAVIPVPIPPGLPVPAIVFFQGAFFNLVTLSLFSTPGLAVSTALP